MASTSELLAIGKITGTHGIRGVVKVHLYSGDDSTLRAVKELVLRHSDGRQQNFSIVALQGHGRKTLLTLKGYESIDEVLPLVGGELVVRRDQFPEPDADEYYWADLIGLRVITGDGVELGALREIIETGSNDVYVVQGRGKEYLIPALVDVIRDIDLEAGTMTVTPLDGLLDL
jgi:16S rRNA processing protein RimM